MMPRVLPHDDRETLTAVDAALETGQTIVFPTDTIYGIGGNPWDERSLARVRTLKHRPADRPFALHLPTPTSIERYAALDERLRDLIERLLPGPYTLLLPAATGAPPSSVREGRVGVRVPAHPFFQQTLARLDRPLFGTSVNRHGEPPFASIDAIIDRFAAVDLIITGPTGMHPSTILDLTETPPSVIRGDLPDSLRSLLDQE
jgi:L-threonylcarbamoyladenylate synthase